MSSFKFLLGFTVFAWILIYGLDVFTSVQVYHKYIVGNCYYLKYYEEDWVKNDDTTFSFIATAEVLVKANKHTQTELDLFYPNIELLLLKEDTELFKSQKQSNDAETEMKNTGGKNSIKLLGLPFNVNISIEEPVGELYYFFRTPPIERSLSPYDNPHRCFFHPITKEVSTNRSILPLFYLICVISITIALTIPLVLFSSQRKQFNNLVPNILLIFILLHFLSLAFDETNDYTLLQLVIDLTQRILFIAATDIFYEYLKPSWVERLHFHYAVSCVALLTYLSDNL